MTKITRPGTVQLLPEARIEGTRDQVREALQHYHSARRLVEFTQPQPIPGRAGRVYVQARLIPAPTVAARPRRRRLPFVLAAIGLAVLAVLAWLTYLAVTWIAAHLAMVLFVLALIVVPSVLGGHRVCKTVIEITHYH